MSGLVRMRLGKGDATVVVYGHEHVLPFDGSSTLGAVTGDAMPNFVEAPEFLDVDVQQLPRVVALIALHRFLRPQVAQAR